jgi:acyl carrier protein
MKSKEELTKEVLFDAIHAYTGIPHERISFDSRFAEDLGYDSLDSVETIMRLEDELNVEISDEAMDKMRTVRDAYDHVITLPVFPTEPLPTSLCTFEGVLIHDEFDGSGCAEIECAKDVTISISKYDKKLDDTIFPEILKNFQNKRVRITIEVEQV